MPGVCGSCSITAQARHATEGPSKPRAFGPIKILCVVFLGSLLSLKVPEFQISPKKAAGRPRGGGSIGGVLIRTHSRGSGEAPSGTVLFTKVQPQSLKGLGRAWVQI